MGPPGTMKGWLERLRMFVGAQRWPVGGSTRFQNGGACRAGWQRMLCPSGWARAATGWMGLCLSPHACGSGAKRLARSGRRSLLPHVTATDFHRPAHCLARRPPGRVPCCMRMGVGAAPAFVVARCPLGRIPWLQPGHRLRQEPPRRAAYPANRPVARLAQQVALQTHRLMARPPLLVRPVRDSGPTRARCPHMAGRRRRRQVPSCARARDPPRGRPHGARGRSRGR